MFKKNPKISIIGMGYVGLPLSIEFGKYFNVVGYDLDIDRIKNLREGRDINLQYKKKTILKKNIKYTYDKEDLIDTNIFIVTVPTPLKANNKPDLGPLISASKLIKNYLENNCIVIYESTVYPGCTEEVCLPILNVSSKFKFNKNFFLGYSPERINVGDKFHNITNIVKVVSGSNDIVAKYIGKIYKKIIKAGVHIAPSIKVAEAAKVIENSQRDLNIAFVNELSQIFHKLQISSDDVLKAASTKWNFLNFKPGLVGGHCIGVDPYYLTYKAEKIGLNPKVILAGRKTNDYMAKYISKIYHQAMKNKKVKGKKILILGLTFKENCPDTRNSKAFEVCKNLLKLKYKVNLYDPYVNKNKLSKTFKNLYKNNNKKNYYDGGLLLVNHDEFLNNWMRYKSFFKKKSLIFDINNKLDTKDFSLKL